MGSMDLVGSTSGRGRAKRQPGEGRAIAMEHEQPGQKEIIVEGARHQDFLRYDPKEYGLPVVYRSVHVWAVCASDGSISAAGSGTEHATFFWRSF
jgi:hypothetical protein